MSSHAKSDLLDDDIIPDSVLGGYVESLKRELFLTFGQSDALKDNVWKDITKLYAPGGSKEFEWVGGALVDRTKYDKLAAALRRSSSLLITLGRRRSL
jgi:hypothetical protein